MTARLRAAICGLCFVLVSVATATNASAQIVVPWGPHNPGELGGTLFFGTGGSYPFDVIYTFNLDVDSNLEAVAVSNDSAGVFDINGQSIGLFHNNGNVNFNDDVLVDSFTFTDSSTTHTFSDVTAGSYYYKALGDVDGPRGGSYLVSSSPASRVRPVRTTCDVASGAGGLVVPWGQHDPGELGGTLLFGTGSIFPFSAAYTFSLAAPTDLLAVAVTNDAPGWFDINCARVELFANNGNANFMDDLLLGSFLFGATSTDHIFHNLAAGNYFYAVNGKVAGPNGGSYLLSSATVDAVPEPAVSALVVGGLVVAAPVLRRRKRSTQRAS